MKNSSKTVYVCSDCGNETAKWMGRCSACGAYNTLKEFSLQAPKGGRRDYLGQSRVTPMKDITGSNEIRFATGIGELDRVLGGGAVQGSLVLVGGTPGIGKSTLLLQICNELCRSYKVLYVSGEESEKQIKLRAERLQVVAPELLIFAETNLDTILSAVEEHKPEILIVDSIQTVYKTAVESSPGSVSQVRECCMSLLQLSKTEGITTFIVGHVNKDGAIAGPKTLEHMVDCVLYFEGEHTGNYRLLRAAKNRFGSTNEIGVFEMAEKGLEEVPNPSEALLSGRPKGASGTCVACPIEGTRPILAEVQALVSASQLNNPRRVVDGIDFNRAVLLTAVLEKRCGLSLSQTDIYLNVIGGLRLDEPATDLAVLLAIASGYKDKPIDDQVAAIGEVGLTGEVRMVSELSKRLAEIERLGFTTCIIPRQGSEGIVAPEGMTLVRIRNIRELLTYLF